MDPKADLTFKRVFGEHPDLVRSFLNALLPLEAGEEIERVEYLPAELVPENPLRKNSIVDVRCRDNRGRQFIVEMQMAWSPEFRQRVLSTRRRPTSANWARVMTMACWSRCTR